MAGTTTIEGKEIFEVKQTPFIKELMKISPAVKRQYEGSPEEDEWIPELDRKRHYEAEVHSGIEGKLKGVERLYGTTILLEPHTTCYSHCRHCLRGLYGSFTLNDDELKSAIDYIASQKEASEVLITGGDPLVNPKRVAKIIDDIVANAPHIKAIRIGSRVPLQNPEVMLTTRRKDYKRVFKKRNGVNIELATQINHPDELTDEVVSAFKVVIDEGVRVYNQAVLLKGVNNDFETLVNLFNKIREVGIESHYLFHAIPMKGTSHLRTSLQEAIDLQRRLTGSGRISGRAKPRLAALTDVGKVEFYPGTIIARREHVYTTNTGRKVIVPEVLLKTGYTEAERMGWNPDFKPSSSTEVDNDGFYKVWYMDAWKNAPSYGSKND